MAEEELLPVLGSQGRGREGGAAGTCMKAFPEKAALIGSQWSKCLDCTVLPASDLLLMFPWAELNGKPEVQGTHDVFMGREGQRRTGHMKDVSFALSLRAKVTF